MGNKVQQSHNGHHQQERGTAMASYRDMGDPKSITLSEKKSETEDDNL